MSTAATSEISLSLGPDDWDSQKGGWRCALLQLPRSKLVAVYSDGKLVERVRCPYEHGVIRWLDKKPPTTVSAVVNWADTIGELSALELAKVKWQKISIVLGFVGTLVGAAVSAIGGSSAKSEPKIIASNSAPVPSASAASREKPVVTREEARECWRNMMDLSASARNPDKTPEQLRASVQAYVMPCEKIIDKLDTRE